MLKDIFTFLPNLINSIFKKESEMLISLLPDNNRKVNCISIHNVQDLCTALEKSYEWVHGKVKNKRDHYLDGLKKTIKKSIKQYDGEFEGFNAYDLTTILKSFEYLDFTLTQKVLLLYEENVGLLNSIYKKIIRSDNFDEPLVDATVSDLIVKFVKMRNIKTHEANFTWNDSICLYDPLLSVVFSCFFKHVGADEKTAEILSKRLFLSSYA